MSIVSQYQYQSYSEKPKTDSGIRKVWQPKTLAYILRNVRPPEEPKEAAPSTLDLESLVEQLRKSPELANTLAALLGAAPSGR